MRTRFRVKNRVCVPISENRHDFVYCKKMRYALYRHTPRCFSLLFHVMAASYNDRKLSLSAANLKFIFVVSVPHANIIPAHRSRNRSPVDATRAVPSNILVEIVHRVSFSRSCCSVSLSRTNLIRIH